MKLQRFLLVLVIALTGSSAWAAEGSSRTGVMSDVDCTAINQQSNRSVSSTPKLEDQKETESGKAE